MKNFSLFNEAYNMFIDEFTRQLKKTKKMKAPPKPKKKPYKKEEEKNA